LQADRVAKGRLRHAARFADNFEEEKKEESVGNETGDGLHHEIIRHYFCRRPDDRLRVEFVTS